MIHLQTLFYFNTATFCPYAAAVKAEDEVDVDGTVEEDIGKSRDGSRTDDEVVQRWVSLQISPQSIHVKWAVAVPIRKGRLDLELTAQGQHDQACAHKSSPATLEL